LLPPHFLRRLSEIRSQLDRAIHDACIPYLLEDRPCPLYVIAKRFQANAVRKYASQLLNVNWAKIIEDSLTTK